MGGVSWNHLSDNKEVEENWRRHPHGWCELKSSALTNLLWSPLVATHMGGVSWNRKRHHM